MIEVRGVHKSFNGSQILKGLNLSIPKGKVTVILGPSGSGKTVLLRHLIGLLKPEKGEILVDGVSIHSLGARELNRFRRRFGMLFQQAALFDSMNVFDNIAFPLREHTDWAPEKVCRVVREKLALVGLREAEEKMPSELSGGMRKRAGLARAIALEPEIILYDEPTTGLDPIMTEAIDHLVLEMQKKLGVTSVIISHDILSAFRVADQMAMLVDGRILECSSPQQFAKSPHQQVQEFIQKGGGAH